MSKIEGLYRNYCEERNAEFHEYCPGGDNLKRLQDFLGSKLNADDYFTAEEILSDLIVEIEENGFIAGSKYIASIANELLFE